MRSKGLARSRRGAAWQYAVLSVAGLALIAVVIAWWGGGYEKVGPEAYKYAIALTTACNQEDESRLEKIASMVEQSASEGELTAQEETYLMEIIDAARNQRWTSAAARVRRLLDDQVAPAADLPKLE